MPWQGDREGPQYGWGRVAGAPHGSGGSWSPWRNFSGAQGANRYDARFRAPWQRTSHGPGASGGYGWEYQGGFPHDGRIARTEAGMGSPHMEGGMAERRSGGLPRGRGRFEVDRWGGTLGSGAPRGYGADLYRRDSRARYGMDYLRDR